MTKQEIGDELNAAKFYGFDSWRWLGEDAMANHDDAVICLTHDRAAREAAALRRNREALSLDAVMPLLEVCGDHGKKHGMEDKRVVFSGRISETTYGDIIAVVEAWKAMRQ